MIASLLSSVLLTLMMTRKSLAALGGTMEWCEYWTLLDQRENHPECALFIYSKEDVLRRIGRFPEDLQAIKNAAAPKCGQGEIFDCLDCEASCAQPHPTCNREHCSRGCVCQPGLVREGKSGECVLAEQCPLLPLPPSVVAGLPDQIPQHYIETLSDMKKLMPALLGDVWKALFGTEQPLHPIVNTNRLLSSIFADTVPSLSRQRRSKRN